MKLLKIILPFLLFTIISNTTFATVSHEGKELREITNSARKLGAKTQQGIKDLAHAFQNVAGNQVGAAGKSIDDLVKASKIFKGKTEQASHFISSFAKYKNTKFTKAGRDLTKHPRVSGFDSTDLSRQTHENEDAINLIAENSMKNIIENGTKITKPHTRYGEIIEYTLPDGYGARFEKVTKKMIGFIEP